MARKTRKQKGRGQSVSRATGLYDEEFRTAIEKHNLEKVRELIDYVDINRKDTDGNTPLQLALKHIVIRFNIVLLLIENGADINTIDKNGKTPLILAVERRKADVVKKLLEKKADINIMDKDKNTALDYAYSLHTYNLPDFVDSKTKIIDMINDEYSKRAGRNLISVSRIGKNRGLPHNVEGKIGEYLSGVSGPLTMQQNRLKQDIGISLAPRVKKYTKKRERGNNGNNNSGNNSNNNNNKYKRARRRPGPTNGNSNNNNNNNMPHVNTFELPPST
jgi:hypothetical protein